MTLETERAGSQLSNDISTVGPTEDSSSQGESTLLQTHSSVICIVGMHRSGTSMVARLLNLCGLYLGEEQDIMPPQKDNPEGFWENIHFVNINNEILSAFGGGWDFVPELPSGWERDGRISTIMSAAEALLSSFQGNKTWGWKDPRSSLTLEFWKQLIPDMKLVICIRSPLEVAQSLAKRGSSSREFSFNLWRTYNQALIQQMDMYDCIVTHFDKFFQDPIRELKRLSSFCGLTVDNNVIESASRAITQGLRHNVESLGPDVLPTDIYTLYRILCERAKGEPTGAISALQDGYPLQKEEIFPTKLIALYLPEFHPIPENDAWRGEGFIEWTNVVEAQPLFEGHYQPHVPATLGNYDLSLPEVRKAQVDLASKYGIYGFCYYHYWFNGRRLLERPFDEVLSSGQPEFPFCLCWANEDWMRAWDGRSGDVLMKQQYSDQDDLAHIRFLCQVFKDRRYIRVKGKPVFLVYRAGRMTDPNRSTTIWREETKRTGIGDIYLCSVESFPNEHGDPTPHGFDAAVEFQPDWANLGPAIAGKQYGNITVYHYSDVAARMMRKPKAPYKRYPCVTPSWDNSPRSDNNTLILLGSTPDQYEQWLKHVVQSAREGELDEQLVFINAWNDWGNGNHLEPDQKFGKAYLEATRRVLERDLAQYSLYQDDHEYHNALALAQAGNHEEAIKALESLIFRHPEHALAHNDLGVLYTNRGDYQRALSCSRLACLKQPTNLTFKKNLADLLYLVFRNTKEALPIYLHLENELPNDIEVLTALGRLYIEVDDHEKARRYYHRIIDIEPTNDEAQQAITYLTDLQNNATNRVFSDDPACESLSSIENIMKSDWNTRAVENARFYVHSTDPHQSEEEFDTSGNQSVKSLVIDDLQTLWGNDKLKKMVVLEIGCGLGRMTKHLAQIFGEVHGIDISGEMIRQARDRLQGIDNVFLYEGNGRDLSLFEPETFHLVFSFIVFQHIPSKEVILNYIIEAYRVLKPGGIFKFQVQGCIDPRWLQSQKDTWHGETVTEEDITAIAARLGFGIVAKHGQGTQYSFYTLSKGIVLEAYDTRSARERRYSDLCSIVIPVFNNCGYTKKCLEALAKNSPTNKYEIIVIDNASTDNTHSILNSRKNIRVLTNTENIGFTKACNQGARIAQGKYVLFLNNDTEPQPGWLDALLEIMDGDPSVGIAGSKLVYPDGRLQEAGGIVFSDGSAWNYGRFDDPNDPRYDYVREVDYVSGASLIVRHDLLSQLNYFDERYSPGYYEDTDLCFGARSHGHKVMYCPSSVVVHHEGVSSGTDLKQGMKRHQVVNKGRFATKWADTLKEQYAPDANNVVAASERGTKGTILIMDPFLPMFDRASGSLRLFTIISLLRKQGYHVTFIARNAQGQDSYATILKKMGVEVYATDPDLLRQMGYMVSARRIDLQKMFRSRNYRFAFISFYSLALQYLPAIRRLSPHTKIIVDTVDIHFIREQRQAELSGNTALLERAEVTKRHELYIYSRADAVITVTEKDWEHISEYLPGKPHFVIPNIHAVDSEPPEGADRNGILFIGNFNHPPNADAVSYFISDIYPHVRERLPGITFTVVGNNPPEAILALKSEDVIITGYVVSTEPYLRQARVSVAPLRYGAGMKGKIGEAMAHGLPVVTTSIGAEGMGLVSGETAFIADNPREFADHIIKLCTNDDTWQSVAVAAKKMIRDLYSPERVNIQLMDILRQAETLQPLEATAEIPTPLPFGTREIQKGLASIVILTFNQLKYTKECVESIRKHTVEPHEIIFVDNGSTDGTVKWLKQKIRKNSHYRLIENRTNLGFAKGCNQGMLAARGEYILLLNNDVVVTKDWLSGMIECLNCAPDIGIVGPMTNNISGPQKVQDIDYGSMAKMEEFADDCRVRNRHRRIPMRRIVGFCMLFKRALVEEIGLIDESFGSGNFEDDDFCLRAVLEGYRNLIAGDVFIYHYGSRSFIGNKIDFTSAMARNRKIFDAKWTAIDPQSTIGKRLLTLIALEKANELNHKDQIGLAVETCLQAIRHSPEDQNACLALAEVLIDAKRHQDALDVLNEMPPQIQDLRRIELIGYCKEGLELHSEAEEFADRALSLNRGSAAALNLKGMLAYKRGDKSTAEGFFQKAIASDPGYGEPYTNLGVLKWAADQKQEGLALLERGFVLTPTLMDISTLYHSAVTTEQQFARAELVFREAVSLYPMHKRLKFLLIDVLIQQGKYDAAMQLIEEAMVAFGTDDGMVAAALEIRGKIGAKTIQKGTKKRPTLSLCMIVKDEEAHIAKCLASVKPIVDEMIVVDTGSTDRTVDIAKSFGAHVYTFEWTNDFSEARNVSLSKATGDWILVLDADEVVSARDHSLLAKTIARKDARPVAYSITTRNYVEVVNLKGWTANDGVYEKEEAGTGWQPSKKVRLFTNDKRIRFEGFVHELVEQSLARVGIIAKECNIPIHHYGQLNTTNTLSKGEEYYLLGKAKLRETSGDFQAIVELARQATELGHYADSLELWHRALELRPEDAEAFLNIGYLYLELGRFSEALDASENAMRLDPDMKEAALNYSICQLCAGDVKRVVIILEDLLKRIPEYPSAMGVIAAAYCIDGQKDKSLHYLDKIRSKGFDCALTFHDHAKRLIAAGRTNYAIALLETAIENRFANNEILSLLTECHQQRNHAAPSAKTTQFHSPEIQGLTTIILRISKDLDSARECVNRIGKHTKAAHEIILMVGETAGPSVKWARKLAAENRDYKVLQASAEQGVVEATNRAMEQSLGEQLVLLDDRVRVTEDWLDGMLECLNSALDIGVVGPMTIDIGGPQQVEHIHYGSMAQMDEFAADFRVRNRHRRIPARGIAGFCMLFRRNLAEQIGFLDASFGSGDLEGDEYCLRASMEGYRTVIAGDVFVHHDGGRSHTGSKMDVSLAMARSKMILYEKWGSVDVSSATGKKLIGLDAIEKANELAHRQQLQEAIETLTGAIKYAPEDKGIYYRLSEILIDAKLFKEALEALQALAGGPEDELRYLELLGYCHEGLDADDQAESCAERALSLRGNSAPALNLKGVLAHKKGDRPSAEECFKKSIAADPSYGEPYTNLGVLAWSAGQKDEALGFLERGFILSPTSADIINLYHKAITDTAQFGRAESFFLDAQTIYPQNQRVAFLLIDLLIHQQKYFEALHEIQRAMLTFGIDDGIVAAALEVRGKIETTEMKGKAKGKATLSLAMIVRNEEDYIAKCLWSAKPIADEMIVVDTGSTDRTKDIARSFGAQVYDFRWNNDFSKARNYSLSLSSSDWILILDADEILSPIDYEQIRKTIKSSSSKPIAYRLTTRNYTNRLNVDRWNANDGKYPLEEAGNGWYPSDKVRLFKRDQRIRFVNPIHESVDPTIVEAGIQIKSCPIPIHHYGRLGSRGKLQEKRKAYYLLSKKKVEEKGDDQHALYELALVAAELERYDEAIELWERFFQLDATMPPEFMHSAYVNMGSVYAKLGRYQEALDVSKKVLELNPALKEAVVNHANCMIWLEDAEKVIAPLEGLVQEMSDYIPALCVLAVAYLLCGQAVKGQDCLKDLRKRGLDTASYLLDQAKILWSLNRIKQTRVLLEATLQIRDDQEARRLLDKCVKSINGVG